MSERVVVVGNGMVGHHFVTRLRESASTWSITVIGEEPRVAYDRVHLSDVFADRSADDLALSSLAEYASWGVKLVLDDRVASIDRAAQRVVTSRGRVFDYDHLVLATGSFPFVPPVPGRDHSACMTYRTVEDLTRISNCAASSEVGVVIGGGLLGLECANALKNLGLETHVVEFAPGLMGVQLNAGASAMLRRKIEALDVAVRTSRATERIVDGVERKLRLEFSDGRSLETDMVVFSAGIRPRDDLARGAGLEVGERGGIVIDERCRTSDPRILAIGECALYAGRIFGLMAPGYRMAEAAADQLVGGATIFNGADMSTKLKLLGVDVGGIGDAHGRDADCLTFMYSDRKQQTYQRLVTSGDGRRLLGAALVGDCRAYDMLLQYYQAGLDLPADPETLLASHGEALATNPTRIPETALICNCHNVTKSDIHQVLAAGACSLADVRRATGASSGCGSCAERVQAVIDASSREDRDSPPQSDDNGRQPLPTVQSA